MREKLTNYEDDIEVHCQYCNQPQREHFVNVGEINGETFLHHWPCKAQINTLGGDSSPAVAGFVPRLLTKLFKAT